MKQHLLSAVNAFLDGRASLDELVEATTAAPALEDVGTAEAQAIAGAVGVLLERDETVARTVAHALVLAVEGLAEAKGDYGSAPAAIINEAVEAVFVHHRLALDTARCRLFAAHHLSSRSQFAQAISAVNESEPVLRVCGETYALACALLLRGECTLRARLDAAVAARDLEEAQSLFRTHGDNVRARICRELLGQFKLGRVVH